MSSEELDLIGRLADKADNFIEGSKVPFSLEIHKQCLVGALTDIRDALRELYVESSGNNPWEDQPK